MPRRVFTFLLTLTLLAAAVADAAPGAPVPPASQPATQAADPAAAEFLKNLTIPPHPRLLFTAKDLPAIKKKAFHFGWASGAYDAVQRRADGWMGREIHLPPRGGQWKDLYVCKKDGTPLGARSDTEHLCPACGTIYSGFPYDDVVMLVHHDELAEGALACAMMYQLTHNRLYALKAREILLDYADRYLGYPLHDTHNQAKLGGGHVASQTYEEAIWLIPMVQATDLIWEILSEKDVATLRDKMFLPAADLIQRHHADIQSVQCWKNTAVGLVGFLFEDHELIADAYTGPTGYLASLQKGVSPEGQWLEGSWRAHFSTLQALWPLAVAGQNCGLDTDLPAWRRMYDAPLAMATPDFRLPAFNDSNTMELKSYSGLYEIMYAHHPLRAYRGLLGVSFRDGIESLVSGVAENMVAPETQPAATTQLGLFTLPNAIMPSTEPATTGMESASTQESTEPLTDIAPALPPAEDESSRLFPESGIAILRHGSGPRATWMAFKYGPHGGPRGHPDKLSFVLYGRGRILADDAGTTRNALPLQSEWYRTTLAHNTVTVDERSQAPATGHEEAFLASSRFSAVSATAGSIYPGVTFRRTIGMFDGNAVIVIDRIDSAKSHLYDLALHCYGQWQNPAGSGGARPFAPPQFDGYRHMRDARQFSSADPFRINVLRIVRNRQPWAPLSFLLAPSPGQSTDFIWGTGVGSNVTDRVPMLLARRRGASTIYVWAMLVNVPLDYHADAVLTSPVLSLSDDEGAKSGGPRPAAAELKMGDMTYLLVDNPGGVATNYRDFRSRSMLFGVAAQGRKAVFASAGEKASTQPAAGAEE